MTKYLSAIVLVATIIVAACSGGSSPSSNPPNPTNNSSWAITSFTASDDNPFVGSVIAVTVNVTKDGAAPPDGTTVTITAPAACAVDDGTGNFPCGLGAYGRIENTLATTEGQVTTSFVSDVDGTYQLGARVSTTSSTLNVTYRNRSQSDTLQIVPPLLPNEGSYDGEEQVVIIAKAVVNPIDVDFIVNGISYAAVVVEVNESNPLASAGSVKIRTPFVTDVDRTQASYANVTMRSAVGTAGEQTTTLSSGFTYLAEANFQIYQPLVPNRGLYDGGEDVMMSGVGIRDQVEVSFVHIDSANEFPAVVKSVQASDPISSVGQITVETPYIPDALRFDTDNKPVISYIDVKVTTYEPSGDSFSLTLPLAFTYFVAVPPDIVWPPLQVYQPLSPNEGFYNGGEVVTISGRAIREPVGVDFTVGGFVYPGIVRSVVSSDPVGATGQILVETPYISGIDTSESQAADIKVWVGAYTEADADSDAVATLPGAFTFIPDPIEPEPTWVLATPAFYLMLPDYGSAAGGESVTIMGRDFRAQLIDTDGVTILQTAPAVDSVAFGGIEGIVQSVSPDGTQIQLITPRYSTTPLEEDTPVDVEVKTSYVQVTDEYTVSKASAYVFTADEPTPEITAIAPTGGPIDGGTQLTIFGHGFQSPAQVDIGALECIGVQVNDDQTLADEDTIVCVTPDYSQQGVQPPVSVPVMVRNVLSGKESGSINYTYGSNLYISGNTPVEGTRGSNVIIYGSGFESPLTIDLACSDACGAEFRLDVLSVSGTEILARIPVDAPIVCESIDASFLITLLESNLETQGGDFTYLGSTPQIYGITPTFVDADGGGEMTITGEFFADEVVVTVREYRMQSNTVTVASDTQVLVNPIPDAELIGLVWDTSPCVDDNGLPGVRVIPTPVDVTVTNMPGDCPTVVLGGLVYEPDNTACFTGLIAAPTFLSFGTVEVGNFDTANVTVTNPGAIDVNMTAATDQEYFSVTPTFEALAPGASVVLTVQFAPAVGAVVPPNTTALILGNLNIGANASGISAVVTQVALSGTAHAEPEMVTNPFGGPPDVWTFPTTASGSCSPIDATSELRISNTGNAVLNLTSVLTNGSFTIASAPDTTVDPGEETTVILQFCPVVDDNALQTGELIISSNDPDQLVLTIDLEGQEQP